MKVKKVLIGGDFLVNMLTTGEVTLVKCCNGLPNDAEFVNLDYDINRNIFFMLVKSESFDNVEKGALIEELDVYFKNFKENVKNCIEDLQELTTK